MYTLSELYHLYPAILCSKTFWKLLIYSIKGSTGGT